MSMQISFLFSIRSKQLYSNMLDHVHDTGKIFRNELLVYASDSTEFDKKIINLLWNQVRFLLGALLFLTKCSLSLLTGSDRYVSFPSVIVMLPYIGPMVISTSLLVNYTITNLVMEPTSFP